MKTASILVASILAISVTVAAGDLPQRPKLAVVVVVDQMRGDYVTRFGPYFSGGLKRLISEGTVFDSASHEHANTETAVGHATLSTGCFPMHHGIVGNEFYERARDTIVYSVDDTTTRLIRTAAISVKREDSLGVSSRYLMRPALGNWLKAAGSDNRVFSVSLKDRAAILMAGQFTDSTTRPDGVYWWDHKTGDFITSTAYESKLPDWVDQFNRSLAKNNWKDSTWRRFGDFNQYNLIGADSVLQENDGIHTTFPHAFTTERKSRSYFDALYYTPYADQLMIKFARQLVANEHPGNGKGTDLLMISCSSADAVGHSFGPQSQEVFDYYLRLDRCLDTLFRELDSMVGRDNYLVALSSDHGCSVLPKDGNLLLVRDYHAEVLAALKEAAPKALLELQLDSLVEILGTDLIIRQKNLSSVDTQGEQLLATSLTSALFKQPFISWAFRDGMLGNVTDKSTEQLQLLAHNQYSGRNPDITVVLKKDVVLLSGATGTTHGSPNWYDRHVPLVFWGHGIRAQHLEGRVRTVDMALTLANLLGIAPAESIDGRSLTPEILR